ncbi:MAG TPA: hypothetical protein ACFYD6_12065 [Candidatus Brocadiia bacterium]|nr:hypothetical protein [Candidatus Brocadiales bacterium]
MRNWCAYLAIVILVLSSLPSTKSTAEATVGISIDKIVENQYIQGRVFGMDASKYSQYKVIVYVLTDKWYIHPYAIGGEGKSYASIDSNGTWSIPTLKREFGAYKVAALIVEKNYKPSTMLNNIDSIKSVARIVKETGYKAGDKDWKL